jgi:hypothetical protein
MTIRRESGAGTLEYSGENGRRIVGGAIYRAKEICLLVGHYELGPGQKISDADFFAASIDPMLNEQTVCFLPGKFRDPESFRSKLEETLRSIHGTEVSVKIGLDATKQLACGMQEITVIDVLGERQLPVEVTAIDWVEGHLNMVFSANGSGKFRVNGLPSGENPATAEKIEP